MNDQEKASALLERCRGKMSGPEIRACETILENNGIPEVWDEEAESESPDPEIEHAIARLCTEFAEYLR